MRASPVARLRVEHQDVIDLAAAEGIRSGAMPGCVVVIGRASGTLFRRAYGARSVEPKVEPMEPDTVFDVASLTKPLATTTSLAVLVDRRLLSFDDRVSKHVAGFAAAGKQEIMVRQLLAHSGGLAAANPLSDYADGRSNALSRIYRSRPVSKPGARVVYSDLGFIVLGELVGKVSGTSLGMFAHDHVFSPLGMSDTTFRPPAALAARAAPTRKLDGSWQPGTVHDPRALALDGEAGHAGLFSTADDIARFSRMMLREGELDGVRVLRRETVQKLAEPQPGRGERRGLGWKLVHKSASGFSATSYGHSGFTGTSLWIDPERDLFVVFLSNRHHPNDRGNVHPFATRIRRAAVQALATLPPAPVQPKVPVLSGLDVLARDGYSRLAGARVGLITNTTGRARDGRRTIDSLVRSANVKLVRIFAPEHGLGGRGAGRQSDSRDAVTGVPIVSLYGKVDRPSKAHLNGIDTLVFDVQDIGTRFYTYLSTMHRALEAASAAGARFVVLDRPNPISALRAEGPVVDVGRDSFVHHFRLPLRHGMTAGEIARMIVAERKLPVNLEVVRVEGWRRAQYFDETGLPWVDPSPNIRSVAQALLYPAIGPLETTNVSVGRGTAMPFEVVGAPWIDASRLTDLVKQASLPGVEVQQTVFTPKESTHSNKRCEGIRLRVTERPVFEPARLAMVLASALRDLHPSVWQLDRVDVLLASRAVLDSLKKGSSADEIRSAWQTELLAFRARREKYLLY